MYNDAELYFLREQNQELSNTLEQLLWVIIDNAGEPKFDIKSVEIVNYSDSKEVAASCFGDTS